MEQIVIFKPAQCNYYHKHGGKKAGNYKNEQSIDNLIKYCMQNNHTEEIKPLRTYYIGSNYLSTLDYKKQIKEIKKTQAIFHKDSGRRMYHYILSFHHQIKNPDLVTDIAKAITQEFFADFQLVFTVHQNTDHLHVHFVFSPVNLRTGKKFNLNNTEYRSFCINVQNLALKILEDKMGYTGKGNLMNFDKPEF